MDIKRQVAQQQALETNAVDESNEVEGPKTMGSTRGLGLPPRGNSTSNLTANKTGGGHIRLGGMSRYLMQKAQSNDSGLDLSPATLQTLVHPLRSSSSSVSSSSLNVRSLFESPASSDESPHSAEPSDTNIKSSHMTTPATPQQSLSVLSEHSTVIEKTITDDSTSKNITRDNNLDGKEGKVSILKEANVSSTHYKRIHPNPDDLTPKDRGFQVPYGYPQTEKSSSKNQRSRTTNVENTPTTFGVPQGYGTNHFNHHDQNNSFPSADVAAVVPKTVHVPNEFQRKAAQTPRPKSCKKKAPVPTLSKKQTGWKFLSEHVQDKEFLILEQLGKGGCGEVSLVMEKDTRKQYALKIVQLHGVDEALVQECINEVEMLIDLKGTGLVVDIQSWEFNRVDKTMKILMEKGQCDLNHTIVKGFKSNRPTKLLKIKYIWESLLVIVEKIHSKGIVHADLKPANFVWVDDNLKIIDFGIASRLQTDLTSIAMANPKGTLNFISPEIIRLDESGRSKLSPKSDIWALGCILYFMVYGRTPFEHINHSLAKMNAIVKGDVIYPQLPPQLQGSQVTSVLKLCFQIDYKRRPSASELLMHPFLHS